MNRRNYGEVKMDPAKVVQTKLCEVFGAMTLTRRTRRDHTTQAEKRIIQVAAVYNSMTGS